MKRFLCFMILCLPLIMHAQEENGIKWTTGLTWNQIKAKAKKENKYIFLDCYATWCRPCKEMDRNVYVNDSVGDYFNQHFISVKVQMDKTQNDDESVKKWYDDANRIKNEYDIHAYPSLLFLSPQGIATELMLGYKDVSQFVSIAQTAKQPGKTYDTYSNKLDRYTKLVADYKDGRISYAELPFMIGFASRLDTDLREELMKTYKEYVIALPAKERYTKENIKLWSSLKLSFQSPFFQFFMEDGEAINKVMNYENYAINVIDKTIQENIVTPFFVEQNTRKEIPMAGMYLNGVQADNTEADWKKLHQLISKQFNNKIAKRNVLAAKIEWYARHNNIYLFCKNRLNQLNKYKPDLWKSGIDVNGAAWNAFKKLTDKKILEGYTKWMGKMVQARPNNHNSIDTYANLLYKLGRKEEAIYWEEKALRIVGENEQTNYKETIEQMKRSEPTNINEAVWEGINTVKWNGVKFSKYVITADAQGKPIEGVTVLNNRSGESKLTNEKGYEKLEVMLGDKLTIGNDQYEKQEIVITKEPGNIQIVLKHQ